MRTIFLILALMIAVGAHGASKNYFPVRIDPNSDQNLAPEGTSFWQLLSWRNPNVNDYRFVPGQRSEARLEEVRKNREEISRKMQELQSNGVKVVLHDYEINPEGFRGAISSRADAEWFLENKLYEVMKLLPGLDGYALTPSESAVPAREAEDIKAYVLAAWRGIKRANDEDGKNRILMVRSWLSDARVQHITEYFPFSADEDTAKNIYLITKEGHGDFAMQLPINPLLGAAAPHPEIVAFDVTVCEYRGFGWYPCGMAHEWSARFKELVKIPRVAGLHAQVVSLSEMQEKLGDFKLYKPMRQWRDEDVLWSPWNHLNAYTFYALAEDPFKHPRRIYLDWAAKYYGSAASGPLADILTLSSDVMVVALGPSHTGYPPAKSRYYYSPLESLLPQKPAEPGHERAPNGYHSRDYNISERMIEDQRSELDRALSLCDKMISILETNQEKFRPDDYARIHADLIGYKSYTEVKKVCAEGAYRYAYLRKREGKERQAQVDMIEQLAKRGQQLYEAAENFLFKKGHTETKSYIHTVRELARIVGSERNGERLRIFPEQVAESLKPLPYRPDGIASIGDYLYILGENRVRQISRSGAEVAAADSFPFEAAGLSEDGGGNLLICAKDAVYRLSSSRLHSNPVQWRFLPNSVREPQGVAYDPENDLLFVGDNGGRRIVQIDSRGKITAEAPVPRFKEERPRSTKKKVLGLTFYRGDLYAVESYSEGPFSEGNRWVYKLRRYRVPGLTAVDNWHLAMGRTPTEAGCVEDVCFDRAGNAWVVSPTQPYPNRVYRIELQPGVSVEREDPTNLGASSACR